MRTELEKKLIDEFPSFFKGMYGDPKVTCLAWGCEHGDGWYDIIHDTCEKISKISKTFVFLQIKEKFASLRMYYSFTDLPSNEDGKLIDEIITEAENRSYKTCEECGTEENVTTEGGWLRTLCQTCRKRT